MTTEDLRPVYDKLDALQGQVSLLSGEMRANMATITATLSERCSSRGKAIDDLSADHDQTKERVSTLEKAGHRSSGYLAGIIAAGGAAGALASIAVKLFSAGK